MSTEPGNQVEIVRPLLPAEVNWKTAQKIANTPFVPSAFRGKPEAVFAAILYGEELGLGPMQSLNSIHVIEGKPSMAPELMRGLVARAGHRIDVKEATHDCVTLWGKRCDNGSEASVTWSMKDAQLAGLAGRGAWKTYPRAMLLARATSELCRMVFADVVAGLSYTPEEASSIAGVEWLDLPVDPLTTNVMPTPSLALTAEHPTTTPNAPHSDPVIETGYAEPQYEEPVWEEAFPDSQIVDAEIVEPSPRSDIASLKQVGMVRALIKEWGITTKVEALGLAAMVLNHNIESLVDLTKKEASMMIDHLQANHPDKV